MDYKEQVENLLYDAKDLYGSAQSITDLLARAEDAEKDLADCREKNAGLALALLTEQPPNSDCLGDQDVVKTCGTCQWWDDNGVCNNDAAGIYQTGESNACPFWKNYDEEM